MLPGILGQVKHELLNLFELMDTEDAFSIPSVGPGLFPETRTDPCISKRQPVHFYDIVIVQAQEGMLGSGEQVQVLTFHLVNRLLEIAQSHSSRHNFSSKKVRWLVQLEALL